jgi:hypothetical protein
VVGDGLVPSVKPGRKRPKVHSERAAAEAADADEAERRAAWAEDQARCAARRRARADDDDDTATSRVRPGLGPARSVQQMMDEMSEFDTYRFDSAWRLICARHASFVQLRVLRRVR